jgi:serine/threonine-protein kinase
MDDRELPPEGRVIGHYRLDTELGRGGMGIVYAALDTRHGRWVALKVIAPHISSDEEFANRFMREARIAVTLEHPNVVPVYETGSDAGVLFIAMRLVHGADLSTVVQEQGALPLERVLRIARQVGSALDGAHIHGLVHRDVKPGNVLLTGSGEEEHAYLTDFGLARESADTSLTGTGEWIGTADYIAPEQIADGIVSARTDIYSLGCVLYELLTGGVPYEGLLVRKLFAHSREPLPSIGDVLGARSGHADAVLARATAKDPGDRYPSAGDLARALAAATTGNDAPAPERSVATGTALTGLDQRTTNSLAARRRAALGAPGLRSDVGGVVASQDEMPESEIVVSLRGRAERSQPFVKFRPHQYTGADDEGDTTRPKPRRTIEPAADPKRKRRRTIELDSPAAPNPAGHEPGTD